MPTEPHTRAAGANTAWTRPAQQLSGEGTHGFTHFSELAGMMLVGAGSVPACCQGNGRGRDGVQEPSPSFGGLHGMCTPGEQAAIDVLKAVRCNCHGINLVDNDVNTRSRPPQLHGALAAAVALSCGVIVIAFPGSVNETQRISSARSPLHYRKRKLPHPRPAAARAVCRRAC
jgi:hypothetical protein